MSEMKTVILKNGAEEAEPLVNVTMMSLRKLMEEQPIAFYEFVELCKDSKHQLFGNASEVLNRLGLIHGGAVHDSIRNIVLSATKGDGFEMELINPVK
jgi:hypothetical protein